MNTEFNLIVSTTTDLLFPHRSASPQRNRPAPGAQRRLARRLNGLATDTLLRAAGAVAPERAHVMIQGNRDVCRMADEIEIILDRHFVAEHKGRA